MNLYLFLILCRDEWATFSFALYQKASCSGFRQRRGEKAEIVQRLPSAPKKKTMRRGRKVHR